jgi:hypothetical protein
MIHLSVKSAVRPVGFADMGQGSICSEGGYTATCGRYDSTGFPWEDADRYLGAT